MARLPLSDCSPGQVQEQHQVDLVRHVLLGLLSTRSKTRVNQTIFSPPVWAIPYHVQLSLIKKHYPGHTVSGFLTAIHSVSITPPSYERPMCGNGISID